MRSINKWIEVILLPVLAHFYGFTKYVFAKLRSLRGGPYAKEVYQRTPKLETLPSEFWKNSAEECKTIQPIVDLCRIYEVYYGASRRSKDTLSNLPEPASARKVHDSKRGWAARMTCCLEPENFRKQAARRAACRNVR